MTLRCESTPRRSALALRLGRASVCVTAIAGCVARAANPSPAVVSFHRDVEPLLQDYCYNCHGDGNAKGKVAFDELSDSDIARRTDLWFAALKNLRTHLMPPAGEDRPTTAEAAKIANWIKYSAFAIQPQDPDPGRVTLRRLNRVEYGRTVHSLLGYDYASEAELPPDDTGGGFDNIGDVLSVSPLLLEKYLHAAEQIVTSAVPQMSGVVPTMIVTGTDFREISANADPLLALASSPAPAPASGAPAPFGRTLAYTETVALGHSFTAPIDGSYRMTVTLGIKGPFNFASDRCQLTVTVDGATLAQEALGWQSDKTLVFNGDETWSAGKHEVSIAVQPLDPAAMPADSPAFRDSSLQLPRLSVRIVSVQVQGPLGAAHLVEPPGYRKFFPRGAAPTDPAARSRYAREILDDFATRAFRRPVDPGLLSRLVTLARAVETDEGGTFEQGISRAMMAIMASPRFLFRFEEPNAADGPSRYPRVDEYALASRLSYFLWSTMPDATLFDLAKRGQLRAHLREQVERMVRDSQSSALVHNFTGQWLQARDVESVPINAHAALGLPPRKPGDFKPGQKEPQFDSEIRRAMRSETEMVFDYIMKGDRSALELIDSDYTFLNERLAKEYGISGVTGKAMRYVALPPDSPRGGVLTEGTVLAVTSNPTRTSPVKRGQFILVNILDTPTPPAPPNIPNLEDAKTAFKDHDPSLREMLAVHRQSALCSSCHSRMDPLGLAFENFNAMGDWRATDAGQPIQPAGKLITGEEFKDVRELKHILVTERREDYYRCLTEKLLTYALGRGLDYGDVEAVDRIVDRLEADGGRFSDLLYGIIDSAPFQKERRPDSPNPLSPLASAGAALSSNP